MYNLTELRQETDEIIENLLADGSDPEALYIIEHHVAHHNFDKLEKLVVDAYKLATMANFLKSTMKILILTKKRLCVISFILQYKGRSVPPLLYVLL